MTPLFVEDRPVDSELRLLPVVDSPDDKEPTALCTVLRPLDADVDRDARPLLVVERPVDSEVTPL